MINPEEFQSRINSFPRRYMQNFNYLWNWKIEIENGTTNILDDSLIEETYRRLCYILPKWQTYRNGDNINPLRTLRDALSNISDVYDQIRNYTLLEYDDIPIEPLQVIWNELGRVKEYNGNTNEDGDYFVISVCKPLLLIWGQTLAFDSRVRKYCPQNYDVPKYSSKWIFKKWSSVMHEFSIHLNNNINCVEAIRSESERRYGTTIIPFGRFLDIYYWVGS